MKLLHGHIDPKTAYVVEDYPYSSKLRCKIRYWIETRVKFGQRPMSQTTNPRKNNDWNKPTAGKWTYYPFAALYLDTNNHVQVATVHYNANSIIQFLATPLYSQVDNTQLAQLLDTTRQSKKYDQTSWHRYTTILQTARQFPHQSPQDILNTIAAQSNEDTTLYYENDVILIQSALKTEAETNKSIDPIILGPDSFMTL